MPEIVRSSAVASYVADDVIDRLTADPHVAFACRNLARSRSAAWAMELAEIQGYRVEQRAGLAGGSALDRDARLLLVRQDLEAPAKAGLIAHQMRHVIHDVAGLIGMVGDLPEADHLAGRYLVEADADAFRVHVAAQMARAGVPGLWQYLAARECLGPAAEAYVRGHRRGGERMGAMMAFESLLKDDIYLSRYGQTVAREWEPGSGTGSLGHVMTVLKGASPAGTAYPERAFCFAADNLVREARERSGAVMEAARGRVEGLRPAA